MEEELTSGARVPSTSQENSASGEGGASRGTEDAQDSVGAWLGMRRRLQDDTMDLRQGRPLTFSEARSARTSRTNLNLAGASDVPASDAPCR